MNHTECTPHAITDPKSVQRRLICMSMHVFVCLSICVHRCLLSRKTHSASRLHIDQAELALLSNKTAQSLIYQRSSLHDCHSHLTPVPDTHKDFYIPLAYPRGLKTATRDLDLNGPVVCVAPESHNHHQFHHSINFMLSNSFKAPRFFVYGTLKMIGF